MPYTFTIAPPPEWHMAGMPLQIQAESAAFMVSGDGRSKRLQVKYQDNHYLVDHSSITIVPIRCGISCTLRESELVLLTQLRAVQLMWKSLNRQREGLAPVLKEENKRWLVDLGGFGFEFRGPGLHLERGEEDEDRIEITYRNCREENVASLTLHKHSRTGELWFSLDTEENITEIGCILTMLQLLERRVLQDGETDLKMEVIQ